jgi:hypothetical protein
MLLGLDDDEAFPLTLKFSYIYNVASLQNIWVMLTALKSALRLFLKLQHQLLSRRNLLPKFCINFNVYSFLLSFGQPTKHDSKYPIGFNGTLWHCHYWCC